MSSFVRQKKKRRKDQELGKFCHLCSTKSCQKDSPQNRSLENRGLFLYRPDRALDNTVPISIICF